MAVHFVSAGVVASGQTPIPGPAGIFVIGNVQPVANETAKYDLDYVSGLTLPVSWRDLESVDAATQAVVYNFSRIDTKLEELRERGKYMTLQIFVDKVPDRVLAMPGTITWTNPHPQQGGVQVVPWDVNGLAAYSQLMSNLANHVVAGTTWRIADHPSLQSIDAPIVGLQGLREVSGTLVTQATYTREGFIQSVVDAVTISRQAFPAKFGFLALFAMDDAQGDVATLVYDRLMTEFNVPGKPSLGFFQETLSDTGPLPTTLGTLLHTASAKTYVMFQALRPWQLQGGETKPPASVASGTPITGIKRAWGDYRSTYLELYGSDVLAPANVEPLRAWHRFWQSVNAVKNGQTLLSLSQTSDGGLRVSWQADSLLVYRLWRSTDTASWALQDSPAPVAGEVTLPATGDTRPQFFRLEILNP
jgi:hypothetical protein